MTAGQNWLATLALVIWPLIGVFFYKMWPPLRATIWNFLGAYLVLPVGATIKIAEGIPQLDKLSVPAIAAIAGYGLFALKYDRLKRVFGLSDLLVLAYLFSPVVTALLNEDAVNAGITLPGVGLYDGLSAWFSQFLILVPFFLGRRLIKGAEDLNLILYSLVIAGLAYSIPILFEIRMSPQLHRWLYGYNPSDFIQQVRDGGFRPTVFIGHGLAVSSFVATCTLAAATLWSAKTRRARIIPRSTTGYLGIILVLCKSLGPLLYGIFGVCAIIMTQPKAQVRVAILLTCIALAYPLLRIENLVPTDWLLATATSVSPERAESLGVRFTNEQQLLERASERFVFGWGRFGRSRVYNEWGKDISIADGRWIITLGQYGLVGYIAEFGLLALAVGSSLRALRLLKERREQVMISGLCLILALNIFDLLPNADLTPLTWLFAGTLLSNAWTVNAQRAKQQMIMPNPPEPGVVESDKMTLTRRRN